MPRSAGKAAPKIREPTASRRDLLSDERVSDWHDDMAKAGRNRLSAISNVRKLGFLIEKIGLSLDEVETIAKTKPEEFRRHLNRYATAATEQGRTANYLVRNFASLRAYFKFRDIAVDPRFFPKLENITGASIANEKVPSQEQLGVVLDRLSLRGKVVALLMAHAGVRPQTIGMYEAADGLVLGDLPELVLDPEPHFAKVPFVINGRASLAKRRKSWTTFGSNQLATALVAYLRERRDSGEVLGPSSSLVTAKETRGIAAVRREEARSKRGFLTTTRVVFEVGSVLHATAPAGVRWRPYVLRAYFSTGLLRASADRELREARQEMTRAYDYLETGARPNANVVVRAMLETIGYTPDEIDRAGPLTKETVFAMLRSEPSGLREAEAPEAPPPAPTVPRPSRPRSGRGNSEAWTPRRSGRTSSRDGRSSRP